MTYANAHPDAVKSLIVVDSTPLEFSSGTEDIVELMASTVLKNFTRRREIHDLLAKSLPSEGLTYFIMKNIQRDGSDYRWKLNISAIQNSYEQIMSELQMNTPSFSGPCLVLKGEKVSIHQAGRSGCIS